MTTGDNQTVLDGLSVRTYRSEDQAAVSRLYTDGLLAGQIADNDTGADIENIYEAYFHDVANHFWVAEVHGQVKGMIGVAHDGHTAEIRRLRVEKDLQNTPIAGKLIEAALYHCHVHGYLKVVLDTAFHANQAVDLFQRYGFQYTRKKSIQGKDLLEFYLDLYRDPHRDEQKL